MTLRFVAGLMLVSALSGCRTKLVPQDERDAMERELLAEGAANRARVCKRPVLRGAPVPGPADGDILAIVVPKPEQPLAACAGAIRRDRGRATAAAPRPPLLDATVDACAGLPEAIDKAVAHEDACSPWLAGRRGVDDLRLVVPLSKVVSQLIERLNRAHDPARGARLLTHWLRLLADLRRGESTEGGRGVPLVAAMVSVAASDVLIGGSLPAVADVPPARDALLDELEALDHTQPTFDQAVAERSSIFTLWYRATKPAGWRPVWGLDYGDEGAPVVGPAPPGVDDSDSPYLGWLAQEEIGRRYVEACPPTASLAGCRTAMDRVTKEAAASAPPRPNTLFLARFAPRAARRKIVAALVGESLGAFPKFANTYWESAFDVRALRLFAWIIAHREPDGRCAQATTIERGAGEARIDPANGRPLVVRISSDGAYRIAPAPADAPLAYTNTDKLHVDFTCRTPAH